MNRRDSVLGLFALAAASHQLPSIAQGRSAKNVRVGILDLTPRANNTHLLQLPSALRELGWVEGKNVLFDWRNADGRPEKLPQLAVELVQLNADVIVANGNISAQATLRATHTTPIVIATAFDPVGVGLAQRLARPGGNVTGLLWADTGLAAKMVEMIREVVPTMRRLAVLYDDRTPGIQGYIDADKVVADAIRLELRTFPVRSAEDVAVALTTMQKEHVDGIKVGVIGATSAEIGRILDFAAEHRLPAIYTVQFPVERGGFLAYSPSGAEITRRVAALVDKVLKGASPAEIPFEHPMRFDFTVNLKTAKALGITVPPNILLRADRVIE